MTVLLWIAVWCAGSAVGAVLLGRAIAKNHGLLRPIVPATCPLLVAAGGRRRGA